LILIFIKSTKPPLHIRYRCVRLISSHRLIALSFIRIHSSHLVNQVYRPIRGPLQAGGMRAIRDGMYFVEIPSVDCPHTQFPRGACRTRPTFLAEGARHSKNLFVCAPHARPNRYRSTCSWSVSMCAEFISVSGFRADRSAQCSVLRQKRITGPVAATERLYTPMNGPVSVAIGCGKRVS